MPNIYRTTTGHERFPSTRLSFELAGGQTVEATWAGSATEEKLQWWLSKPGHELAQSEPTAAVAVKADDDDEILWGDAPAHAHLIFVLEPQLPGKTYRLAKMVTTAATPAQAAYFRHTRFALFGTLRSDGGITRIPPHVPPPPRGPAQGSLF